MGKGTFKAYEKGEWGRDVVAAWGFVDSHLGEVIWKLY
jgi:hypothetical protein